MKLNRTQIKTIVDVIHNQLLEKHYENVKLVKDDAIKRFKKLPIYKKILDINDFDSKYSSRRYGNRLLIHDSAIEELALNYFEVKLPKFNNQLIKIEIENKLILKTIGSDIDITSIIEQIKNEL